MSKSVRILSIEAKDLYSAMNQKDPAKLGYGIRGADGKIKLKRFINALDWSLDAMKLQEEYQKVTRRKNFYFTSGNKRYTTLVINVTFSYSYKLYNKEGKSLNDLAKEKQSKGRKNENPQTIYVKAGYSIKTLELKDCVCVKNGELVAIQINTPIENPADESLLGDYFEFEDGVYKQKKTFPVLMSRAELREYLYQTGFVCDGHKYVRYKRSAGSSRVGKCLFIDIAVSGRMAKWDRCGLKVKTGQQIDLAGWEAYTSLSQSSIIDTIEIRPEEILLVEDFNSVFSDEVVAVTEINGVLESERCVREITNNIWDGESLMDASKFEGKYENKGMLLLRNRMFKTCAFNTNIQKFFEDNGIVSVSQLNGATIAEEVSQIKLITTPSSIKFLKFGTFEQWLGKIEPIFGIVKYEKPPHFFDGRMVQCHYQLLNSLELDYPTMEKLLKPSLEYIKAVRSDPAVLRYHIKFGFDDECDEDEAHHRSYKTKNEIIFKMLGINDKFSETAMYQDFVNTVVKGFYRNLRKGHILLNGNYSVMLGNGMELLRQAIGKFDGESSMPVGYIHSKRFEYGKSILGTRSPHILAGNVLIAENRADNEIDKYFNMSTGIVYINSIGENILQRLNGCDFDSDSLLLTDNETLVGVAKRNYERFKVPTSFIDSEKRVRYFTPEDRADLDVRTSVNKIGEIVNLSQQLNSLYWERRHNGESYEDCEGLYNDTCKLAALSGLEIDRAKREYTIDSGKEINILKKKYQLEDEEKTVKPMFFKTITLENGYELSDNIKYKWFNTPMDYLQKIIFLENRRQAKMCKNKGLPFMDVVREPKTFTRAGHYYTLRDKIISEIRRYKGFIKQSYVDYESLDDDAKRIIKENVADLRQQCMDFIDGMSSHPELMYMVLKELESKENRDIKSFMFDVLFGKPNESFICMINESKEPVDMIIEDPNGEERYYDFWYTRLTRNKRAEEVK